MRLPFNPTKVNARIAAGRSVLTRTVVDHDKTRLHCFILDGNRSSGKFLGRGACRLVLCDACELPRDRKRKASMTKKSELLDVSDI